MTDLLSTPDAGRLLGVTRSLTADLRAIAACRRRAIDAAATLPLGSGSGSTSVGSQS